MYQYSLTAVCGPTFAQQFVAAIRNRPPRWPRSMEPWMTCAWRMHVCRRCHFSVVGGAVVPCVFQPVLPRFAPKNLGFISSKKHILGGTRVTCDCHFHALASLSHSQLPCLTHDCQIGSLLNAFFWKWSGVATDTFT